MILSSMDGKSITEYTFTKKAKVVVLNAKSLNIDNHEVNTDPQLLFQRLITVANAAGDLESVFKYELSNYTSALFDTPFLLREPHKPDLADAIWELLTPNTPMMQMTDNVQYVLDGRALIQCIPWSSKATYKDVCYQYTEYVLKKYGKAIVVFDGYESKTTKDMTQSRQSKGSAGPK
jgi:hypothetical protein